MYPNLYFALYDLFGLDWPVLKLINSFGLMVALAFLAASKTLSMELKRKEKLGQVKGQNVTTIVGKPASKVDLATNGLIGFIFGYKFIYLFINAGELFAGGGLPQQHIFSAEGSLLWGVVFAAAFAGWRYYETEKTKLAKPEERTKYQPAAQFTGNITLVAAVGGIIGAKFFHLFENPAEFMEFFKNPSLDSFLGGLTIYGGLIVGALAVYLYSRRIKVKFIHLCDATAPGLMLAYGIGRMGCHISGDGDWGIPNTAEKPGWLSWLPDWAWSYPYPNNVNAVFGPRKAGYTGKLITENDPWPIFDGYGTYLDPGVYPTPLYETAMALAIFALLWALRKRIQTPGLLFAIYLMFNGLERFFIEKIRVNSTYTLFGFEITQAEIISTLTFIGGVVLFYWLYRKQARDGAQTAV
jgi:prolipoprotein diacylglyceryl transferase